MIFQPNQHMLDEIRAELAQCGPIFWVLGGSCSGKSTVCQAIGRKKSLPVYDMDAHIFDAYTGRYTRERHPAVTAWFGAENSLDWVISLGWDEFDSLNRAADVEYLDLFSEDMRQVDREFPLLVDGGVSHPSILSQVIPGDRIVCLDVDPETSAGLWNSHPERIGMKEMIFELPSPEEKWRRFLDYDRRISETLVEESRRVGIMIYRRQAATSVDQLADALIGHFGLRSF